MTHFNLKNPCKQCPFRNDRAGYLTKGRAEDIVYAITERDGTFTCHKTDRPNGGSKLKDEHCAGASILLEKIKRPNQMMRIMERFGGYDHTKLNMKAPVYDTTQEFIDAQLER